MTGAYALQLVRLATRWHVSPENLLDGLDLTESDLAEPRATVPLETVIALCERARALTREPGLGFHLGLSMRASVYGFPGFAAMTAETLRQAEELAIRYAPLLTTLVSLRLEVQGDVSSLIVDEHSDPRSARDILLISAMVGLRQVGEDITAGRLKASIELSIPQPDYYVQFAHLVPRVRFGQPVNRLVADASAAALPLSMAHPAAFRLAGEQCESALEALGLEATFVARVRRVLNRREGFRSLRHVAKELGLSERRLMKMLAEQQTSFGDLLEQERQQRAMRLLSTSHLTLKEIAAQLGYSAVSNFVRAFHRSTGQTPAAYRRNKREG